MTTITAINHSSLLIEDTDFYYLTDPWVMSPAFGGWTQSHLPRAIDIENIKKLDPKKLAVIISHGHDDHFDDYFCSTHLKNSEVIIPKYSSPGFHNRASKSFDSVLEVSDKPVKHNNATITSHINPDFTSNDSIIVLELSDCVIVHANDNWHKQKESFLQDVKSRSKPIYYFSQLGIADAFPMTYPNISYDDKIEIITDRLTSQISALNETYTKLGLEGNIFCYANQAEMINTSVRCYDILQELLVEYPHITQLTPGTTVKEGALLRPDESYVSYLAASLIAVEKQLNFKLNNQQIEVKFSTQRPIMVRSHEVYYVASPKTWSDIMTGKLTLESISIGACGEIIVDPLVNIRDIHNTISNFSYRLQYEILNEAN